MELSIVGWEAEGLRCPDHKITLINEHGENIPRISLIQMPNGTGKTTTLELLRAALSGKYANDTSVKRMEVKGFKKKGSDADTGRFKVEILCNQKKITIDLVFDFLEGSVSQSTTTTIGGKKEGFDLPGEFREFEKILRPEFINYLIFDGELAQQFLDRNHTNAQYLIEHLFQIDLFVALRHRLEEYWDRKTDKKASSGSGMTARKNKVSSLKKRVIKLEKEREDLLEKQTEATKNLKNLKEKHQSKINSLDEYRDKVAEAQKKYAAAEQKKKDQLKLVLNLMREPNAVSLSFSEQMIKLNDSLDKLKLPESTSKGFFSDLAEGSNCICGTEIGAEQRQHILDHAEDYLADDCQSQLNAIKQSISKYVSSEPIAPHQNLNDAIQKLKDLTKDENEAKTVMENLEKLAGQNDPELQAVQKKINEKEDIISECKNKLRAFEDVTEYKDDNAIKNISILKKKLTDAETAYAEITDTVALKKRKEVIEKILERAKQLSMDAVNKEVCEISNSRINELMPHNDIQIDKIERCLVLKGQSGGSAGETLTVAYAFLSSLFNKTDLSLPFVVDSPAGPLDIDVRKEIARIIPNLSNQFIAFTISSENVGFLNPLRKASDDSINYITVFRKGRSDLEKLAKKCGQIEETKDGLVVNGRDFFENFQLDEEE